VVADRRSTLDLVGFETVRDGGVVETATAYAMLVEIEPREWLTLSEDRRSGVYVSFLTFLRGLQFPTQFLAMTTEFDAEPYLEQFVGPGAPNAPSGVADPVPTGDEDPTPESTGDTEADTTACDVDAEPVSATDGGVTSSDTVADSPILEYGRIAHAGWLERTLSVATVRDRRFFVAVAVDKGEADGDGGSRVGVLRDALPLGRRARTVEDEAFYLDEVWARAQRVAAQLPRTRVETSILDSREAVLDVLYRLYRGREPPIAFTQGTLIRPDEATVTDAAGRPLDLARVFQRADREAAAVEEHQATDRPDSVGDCPYDGRVQEAYVDRVDGSRLLQWYVETVGPIGKGTRSLSPTSVYVGVAVALASVLIGVAALGAFLASGQGLPGVAASPVTLRELAYVLAAASLPTFLLGLVVLLPSGWIATALGGVGTAAAGGAIWLFRTAYPAQWSNTPTGQTALVVQVYALGLFALVVALAVAVRSRQRALADVAEAVDTVGSEPARDPDRPAPHAERVDG
jgi:hypothetical protein